MKLYLFSLGAGLLVGVIYCLLSVRSPAPPLVALVGLLGILLGEQIIPENVAWFSNEDGKRGRIEAGQFADLIVPSKDFFSIPEDEISFLTSDLTVVGGKIVYGASEFALLDDNPLPPAMPDWSPTRTFKGYGAWGEPDGAGKNSLAPLRAQAAASCGCASACGLHGHDHARAWASNAPTSDLQGFFGALGCSCWAV